MPRAFARSADITTAAAAPSDICDELPAVTVPFAWNAGLSESSASSEVSTRGPSSTLKMAGLKLSDIDVIELNEAFAAQSLAVIKEAGLDPEKVNPNGGAIALGHPLGCTGAKLTATIIRELKRRDGRYGMVTMCVGGGMGAAGIFENLS